MSGWLLDTNVISAFAPGKAAVSPRVAAWFEAVDEALFVSAITAAEIGAGIAKLRRAGAVRRATALAAWFDALVSVYGERVLAFDLAAARTTGEIIDAAQARGHIPGFADAAIAGIARTHDLIVLTANTRHFTPLDVPARDPFQV